MKKIIIMSCLSFATAFSSIAQDNNKSIKSSERANHLSDQMIRDLRLNNYQANRIRAINQQAVNEMMAAERQYAANPELVDKTCKGICKERDQIVEAFLSSDQYSQYYASRSQYYKEDRNFANTMGMKNKIAMNSNSANQQESQPRDNSEAVANVADTK
ncbi:MAG: hypothetical protein ACO1NZ_03330 [Adhaeribacter sp.]